MVIIFTVTYVKSHISFSLKNLLETQEKDKKRKYLLPCLSQQNHFAPFVISVDGLLGHKSKMLLK